MSYIDITWEEFNNTIANNLGDSEKVYRTEDEIDLLIKQALLTFAATSFYWKSQISIETTDAFSIEDKQIYDILSIDDVKHGFDNIKTSLKYSDVLEWIDIDLVRYNSIATSSQIINLITNAINLYQTKTKLILDQTRFNIVTGQDINIGEDVIDILSAYYIDSSGRYYVLQLADEYRVSLYNKTYPIDFGRPKFYSINNLTLNVVDLFPKPSENGHLEIIYVKGKDDNQTLDSSCLIPDNLVPYIKFKVEADLFNNEGDSDPFRAEYCNTRWQEGLIIGENYTSIINARLNNLVRPLSSFGDFDKLRYDWRNDVETANKKINAIALSGYNILGLNRTPINVYNLLLDVVSNAPIASNSIDLRQDYIPALLDYCLHLAAMKDGIAAIQQTNSNLEHFIKVALKHNQYMQQRRISHLDSLQKSKYPLRQARILQEEAVA